MFLKKTAKCVPHEKQKKIKLIPAINVMRQCVIDKEKMYID